MERIFVPPAALAQATRDDEAMRQWREEIKRRLLRGEQVQVNKEGGLQTPTSSGQAGIQVPPGKLAHFYWYQRDPELFAAEKEAMAQFFPEFALHLGPDGRYSWIGTVTPGLLANGRRAYLLQLVYEHNHPNNSTYGGSIRVYPMEPTLEELAGGKTLPHTLEDSAGVGYLCTARREDFKAGQVVTTAASALSWAVKWLAAVELWLEGEIPFSELAAEQV